MIFPCDLLYLIHHMGFEELFSMAGEVDVLNTDILPPLSFNAPKTADSQNPVIILLLIILQVNTFKTLFFSIRNFVHTMPSIGRY
jgi:hypothetical protein